MGKYFTRTGGKTAGGAVLWRTASGALLTRSEISSFYAAVGKANKRIDEYNKALEAEKYVYETGDVTTYAELRKAGVPIDFIVKKKDIEVGRFKSRKELDVFMENARTGESVDTIIRKKNELYEDNFFKALKKAGYDEGDVDDIRERIMHLPPQERDKLFRQNEIFNIKKPYENRDDQDGFMEALNDILDEYEDADEEALPF